MLAVLHPTSSTCNNAGQPRKMSEGREELVMAHYTSLKDGAIGKNRYLRIPLVRLLHPYRTLAVANHKDKNKTSVRNSHRVT